MAIASRRVFILGAALIALLPIASAEDWFSDRDSQLISVLEGVIIPEPIKYSGSNTKFGPLLNGRSLVESWLRPRELVCNDPGWAVCPSNLGCCPQAGLCCPSTNYCKTQTSEVCCPGYGACTAGYECSGFCNCIENGAQCCSDGRYCQAGNICVVSYYGQHGCCTDLKCTAYVSSGVTVPLTTNAPQTTAQPVTTPPPKPTVTAGTYYYFTITWSYYFYYYTYIVIETTSTLTSSYTTVYTTISVYGTNAAAASSSFSAVSATLAFSTPADATTALAAQPASSTSGSSAVATGAASTSGSPIVPSTTSSSSSKVTSSAATTSATSPRVGGATLSAGGTARVPFAATFTETWMITALAGVALVHGVVMLWL